MRSVRSQRRNENHAQYDQACSGTVSYSRHEGGIFSPRLLFCRRGCKIVIRGHSVKVQNFVLGGGILNMIQLIIGEKGRGKTKILLDKVNTEINSAIGSVVYLDKSKQHMYEINNKVRLIDVTDFPLEDTSSFIGFICGMISKDRDLELVYLDSFLKIAKIEEKQDDVRIVSSEKLEYALNQIKKISDLYSVRFVISISITKDELPDDMKEYVIHE